MIEVQYIIEGYNKGIWDELDNCPKLSQADDSLITHREKPGIYTEHRLVLKTTQTSVLNI